MQAIGKLLWILMQCITAVTAFIFLLLLVTSTVVGIVFVLIEIIVKHINSKGGGISAEIVRHR